MWAIAKRAVPPIVLLLVGAGLLVYGLRYHRVQVVETKTFTEKVPAPLPMVPGMWPGGPPGEGPPLPSPPGSEEPAPGGEEQSPVEKPAGEMSEEDRALTERFAPDESLGPGGMPFAGPGPFGSPDPFGGPPRFTEEKYTKDVELDLSETAVILDVTVGGLALEDDGQLKRTYPEGQPPSLCPT